MLWLFNKPDVVDCYFYVKCTRSSRSKNHLLLIYLFLNHVTIFRKTWNDDETLEAVDVCFVRVVCRKIGKINKRECNVRIEIDRKSVV